MIYENKKHNSCMVKEKKSYEFRIHSIFCRISLALYLSSKINFYRKKIQVDNVWILIYYLQYDRIISNLIRYYVFPLIKYVIWYMILWQFL